MNTYVDICTFEGGVTYFRASPIGRCGGASCVGCTGLRWGIQWCGQEAVLSAEVSVSKDWRLLMEKAVDMHSSGEGCCGPGWWKLLGSFCFPYPYGGSLGPGDPSCYQSVPGWGLG